jgi:O-glycosyl hydrolase
MSLLAATLALVAQQALAVSITVNPSTTYQTMDGFGFSDAFGFVSGLYSLPSAAQTQGFELLFSTTSGAGLNIVRNRIPSGSDSIEPNSPGSPSATLKYVSIGTDDNQIWFSQKAQSYGVTTFYADAGVLPDT